MRLLRNMALATWELHLRTVEASMARNGAVNGGKVERQGLLNGILGVGNVLHETRQGGSVSGIPIQTAFKSIAMDGP